jgi:hypothetical protein
MAGQKAALVHLFRWPLRILLGMSLLVMWMLALPSSKRWMGPERSIFVGIFVGGMLALLADFFVMGPTGIWSALTTSRHVRAILKTMRIVLLPSWVAVLCFWFFPLVSRGITNDTVNVLVVLWFVFSLGVDVGVLAWTRSRLQGDFRELAATGQRRAVESSAGGAP